MHTIARDELIAQHMADLHQQAAKQRLRENCAPATSRPSSAAGSGSD